MGLLRLPVTWTNSALHLRIAHPAMNTGKTFMVLPVPAAADTEPAADSKESVSISSVGPSDGVAFRVIAEVISSLRFFGVSRVVRWHKPLLRSSDALTPVGFVRRERPYVAQTDAPARRWR